MSIPGIALTIFVGTIIGFYIIYPHARPEGVLIVAAIHASFSGLVMTVGKLALEFFGLRLGRR